MKEETLETYNGWKNRETWLVNVWLNNDQISYNYLRSVLSNDEPKLRARNLSVYFDELLEDGSISLWTDLLREVLSKVDWQEIATSQ